MRILQVITAFHLGGAEESVVDLAAGLAGRGHDCCVVAVNRPAGRDALGEHQKGRLSEAGVAYVELGGPHTRLNALLGPFRLASLCRRWRPDIVHSHTDVPDFTVSLAGRISRLTLARTVHSTGLWPTRRLMGWICESGFQDDLVIFISPRVREAYRTMRRKFTLRESSRQLTIVTGISPVAESDRCDRGALVRDFGADAGKTQFCFAGRFSNEKGFDVLLEALEMLPDGYRERLQVQAFGDGRERESYARRATQRRLPVVFHPPLVGINRLFSAFDAVVVPSRFEGLCRVAVESLLAGVPVIGSSAPGLVTTLPPRWPLMVPPEDAGALGHLVRDFLDGKFDRARLRETAARWVGEKFAVDRMVTEYEAAYRSFLSSGGTHKHDERP